MFAVNNDSKTVLEPKDTHTHRPCRYGKSLKNDINLQITIPGFYPSSRLPEKRHGEQPKRRLISKILPDA